MNPETSETKERTAQMMQAFNVYRTSALLDVLDRPRIYAFVQGVAASSEGQVISADPAGVVLKVEEPVLNALEQTGVALVESPLHAASYKAKLTGVDEDRRYVMLAHFVPFYAYQERRLASRAKPAAPMLAQARCTHLDASGRVVDLSLRSLAADLAQDMAAQLPEGVDVELEVRGNETDSDAFCDFTTTARVVRATGRTTGERSAWRTVFEFEPYPALEVRLRRYVAQRQREVMIQLGLSEPRTSGAHA